MPLHPPTSCALLGLTITMFINPSCRFVARLLQELMMAGTVVEKSLKRNPLAYIVFSFMAVAW